MGVRKENVLDAAVICVGWFCYFAMGGIVGNVGALTVRCVEAFNSTRFEVAWIGSLNNGFTFGFSLVAALIIEKLDLFLSMAGAGVIVVGTMILGIMIPSLHVLYILFILTGSAMSVAINGSTATIALWFDKRRGFAFAIAGLGSALGSASVAFVTGWAGEQYGYQGILAIFSILGGLLVLSAPIYFYILKQKHSQQTLHTVDDNACQNLIGKEDNKNSCENSKDEVCDLHKFTNSSDRSTLQEYYKMFQDVRLGMFFVAYTLTHVSITVLSVMSQDMVHVMFNVPDGQTHYVQVAIAVGALIGRGVSVWLSFFKFNRLVLVAFILFLNSLITIALPLASLLVACLGSALASAIFGYLMSDIQQIIIEIFGTDNMSKYVSIRFTADGLGALGAPISGIIKDNYSYVEAFIFSGSTLLVSSTVYALIAIHPRTRADRIRHS